MQNVKVIKFKNTVYIAYLKRHNQILFNLFPPRMKENKRAKHKRNKINL